MRRWQKTTMEWRFVLELETDIPVDDWPEPTEKKFWHSIRRITATAMHDRTAKIEVAVKRVSISPTTQRQAIVDRLESAFKEEAWVEDGEKYSEVFTLGFQLNDGDRFCETCIEMVRKVLKAFHIDDPRGSRLASFTVTQETFVEFEKAWITFENWLRMRFQLPVAC